MKTLSSINHPSFPIEKIMSSGANPSLPTSIHLFVKASLERRDPHSESTGSVSVNSPEKKKGRRKATWGEMRDLYSGATVSFNLICLGLSTSEAGPSQSKQGEAKWPPENEARFISLMLDQVILGNCIEQKFKKCNWMEIQKRTERYMWSIILLRDNTNHEYGIRLGSATGKITGGDELWARWITDKDMRKRVCVHYRELTTIFNGTTATGSGARASTQTPNENGRRRRTNSAVTPNYLFPDELSDEPMNTPASDRCTRRRRGTTSTFDTAMNSITEASRII
ncbi:DHHC-type zinc finger family protein [Striga asiatica]|uniref:DHHC-type zinc finger family protein n=1 Tax=Striga asiatica TaxID=4170 RepID=A0A5A7QMS3_STRAF|nr:DHHC-type zinc finger family protein [Striga asiatica]